MADNQPVQTPAPDGSPQATPQVPEQKPAETTPPAATLELSDEQKTYLKGQGLSDDDLNSSDALVKIISHAQSSQKTASQLKSELDKVRGVVSPQPEHTNPLLQPAVKPEPTQPKQEETKGIDPVTAFNLSTNLATSFPELKDELVSGKLFQDIQESGVSLFANGQVNLGGILKYAEQAQKLKQYEAQIEELTNKPGAIPEAKPNSAPTVADDAPMTKQIAQAILVQDPTGHPRAAEAKDFLAKN